MDLPTIAPEWRTSTVLDLCRSMRAAQDFSALPILADALQDAGCPEGAPLLAELRLGFRGYARAAALVGCVAGAESAEAVRWLDEYAAGNDCPAFEVLIAAATGHHDDNRDPDEGDYVHSENDGEYLYFGGRDAHGPIGDEFWDRVEAATGARIPKGERARHFSCSC